MSSFVLTKAQHHPLPLTLHRPDVFRSVSPPYFDVFYEHHTVRITIDSGAIGNMIRASTTKAIGCNITDSSQSAHQADGSSPLDVIGETRLTFTRNGKYFTFVGLVVENLDVEVLAGTPFMKHNYYCDSPC